MNTKLYRIKLALLFSIPFFFSSNLSSQTPEKMSYQAVVRKSDNSLVTNAQVGMKISILAGSATGAVVYTETKTATTNGNGLVSLEIGDGSNFNGINWSNGTYFIKTETDTAGGTNYTITGTSQLLSVPYALHAKTAASVPNGTTIGDMQYWNGSKWTIIPAGNEGDVLTFKSNMPKWVGESTGGISTVLNPVTGKIWMDRNLGASQVATSSTDAAAFGDLYQWGRGTDGHQNRLSVVTTSVSNSDSPGNGDFIANPATPFDWRVPQNSTLWNGATNVNNPCPSGFRLPTESEWEQERATWATNNAAGAFGSPLKLTIGGMRAFGDGAFNGVGVNGNYWSSTLSNEAGGIYSRFLYFKNTGYVISSHRATANSVRCIKD